MLCLITIAMFLLMSSIMIPSFASSSNSGISPANTAGPPIPVLKTLTSPSAQSSGDFGNSVSISGITIVVGAYGETAFGTWGRRQLLRVRCDGYSDYNSLVRTPSPTKNLAGSCFSVRLIYHINHLSY